MDVVQLVGDGLPPGQGGEPDGPDPEHPEHFAAKPDLFTWDFVPTGFIPNDAVAHANVTGSSAASRAAVVLSAAGCPLTGGAHD